MHILVYCNLCYLIQNDSSSKAAGVIANMIDRKKCQAKTFSRLDRMCTRQNSHRTHILACIQDYMFQSDSCIHSHRNSGRLREYSEEESRKIIHLSKHSWHVTEPLVQDIHNPRASSNKYPDSHPVRHSPLVAEHPSLLQ